MFANQRGNAGLNAIIAVALLVALYVAGAGMLLKTYREGAGPGATNGCTVACRSAVTKDPNNG